MRNLRDSRAIQVKIINGDISTSKREQATITRKIVHKAIERSNMRRAAEHRLNFEKANVHRTNKDSLEVVPDARDNTVMNGILSPVQRMKWLAGIQSTTTNPRVWHPAARLAFHASLVDPLGPEYLAPIPIDVCRRSVTEHDDAFPRNDPTIMSPIYFETELDVRKRTQPPRQSNCDPDCSNVHIPVGSPPNKIGNTHSMLAVQQS